MTNANSSTDPTRLADCLALLAEPRELADNHRSIAYLMHHKHQYAIVSTLVTPGQAWPDRFTRKPPEYRHAVRRWELLADYTRERVEAARVRGRVEAQHIEATVDRKDWPAALGKIEHPLVRDTAADVLRGWW